MKRFPGYLYQYSSASGIRKIVASGEIKASEEDVPHGPGVFLTDISPDRVVPGPTKAVTPKQPAEGKMSIYQFARRIMGRPIRWVRCTNWVKVDVRGLPVRKVVDPKVQECT